MAKVKKILGSLVGVSALWLGGTAYISSNAQSYLDAYVKKTNALYESNGMQLSVENFEKGFFSSQAELLIDFTNPEMKKLVSKSLKLPLKFKYDIENGPLLFKNGLALGLSRISDRHKINDYLVDNSEFKKSLKNELILKSIIRVDFTKNAHFDASLSEIVIEADGETLKTAPLLLDGKMNLQSFKGDIDLKTEAMYFTHKDDFFKANNLAMHGEIREFYDNGFYLGDFKFDVGEINTKGLDLPFSFEKAQLSFDVDISKHKNETVNMDFKLEGNSGASKLPDAYAFLKKASLNYSLKGMKLDGLLAFQDFTKALQIKQADIVSRLISPTTGQMDMKVYGELEAMQDETKYGMIGLLPSILKKDSSAFDLAINLEDKANKKSTLALNIDYVGDIAFPKDAKEIEKTFQKELLNLLSLDMNVKLEKDYIANLPAQLQQELAGELQMGAMLGIVKENNSSFSFEANLKPNMLKVNGEDRSSMLEMLDKSLSLGI